MTIPRYRYRRSMALLSLILLQNVKARKRIVGGNQAAQGDFPFFVDINGCGASLIAPAVVLTAAHCSEDISMVGTYITVGAYIMGGGTGSGAAKALVTDSIPHPQYDYSSINYDFALLRLEGEVHLPTSSNIVFKINKDENLPAVGQNLTVVGLGRTRADDVDLPTTLQEVVVQAIDHETCNKQYNGDVVEESMFCAGVEGGGKDSCQGDSGGPLFVRNGKEHIQVGVVSWGEGCAEDGHPGVYSRISHAYDWIQTIACGCWNSNSTTLCQDFVGTSESCPTPTPIFTPDPNCRDFDKYKDEFGDTCEWYAMNDEPGCPVYGDAHGGDEMEDTKPKEACCYCGGGGERSPTTSSVPTVAPIPTDRPTPFFIDPDCKDYEGFSDMYGDRCSWYAEFDQPGCPVEGETGGGDGYEDVTANEACCTCGGGGERDPTEAPGPTLDPTPEMTYYGPRCRDFSDWKDAFGDSCLWYETNDKGGCPSHGHVDGGPGYTGISASEACCYCGGGTEGDSLFTKHPTPSPSKFVLDPNCRDVSGFQDSYGDDCSWYSLSDEQGCPTWGKLMDNDGNTANEACCYCGGGTVSTSGPYPTAAPETSAAPKPSSAPSIVVKDVDCLDLASFVDYFGDNCTWYSTNDDPGCPLWGRHPGGVGFENYTAQASCCYCGGGLTKRGSAVNETISSQGVVNTDSEAPIISSPTNVPVNDGTGTTSTISARTKSSSTCFGLLLPLTLALPLLRVL